MASQATPSQAIHTWAHIVERRREEAKGGQEGRKNQRLVKGGSVRTRGSSGADKEVDIDSSRGIYFEQEAPRHEQAMKSGSMSREMVVVTSRGTAATATHEG